MKAVVLHGVGNLRVETLPDPVPGPDEVVIRVAVCGICGTDLHIYQGQPGSAEVHPPVVLGHELAGEVLAVGTGVTKLRVGDRVSVDPNLYCGVCRFCRDGRIQMCEHLQAIGVTRNGGMAELCVVPAKNCHRLPDGLGMLEGALVEPLACCVHGIERLSLRPGQSALVIGAGYIGLMMVQLLRLYGAGHIVVSEPEARKRELALSLGADSAINPNALPDHAAGVPAADAGTGFDVVIECVGRAETMHAAVEAAGRGGQILLFGVANPDAVIQVRPYQVFAKELTIAGSFVNPYTHRAAVALAAQGRIQMVPLVSHRFAPDDIPSVMECYRGLSALKGVIVWMQ
ncbi:zinc-dependent alcohol dehydrogenase family protein [Alicyclobacillus kakegawensis]|uniref:zinc-dependent alcohol dehydrogenase family protein n=1 Tax=Alicyclobacillus kakegawensis TaxID=392012 RepID=UPI0008364733|nr:zinc-dependent alcohol dehydrogenase family protein [Alicyclobacillus kakegawensis]